MGNHSAVQIDPVTLTVGAGLILAGSRLAQKSRATLRRLYTEAPGSFEVRAGNFLVRRYRRRYQASLLIVLLGILIVCTDVLPLLTSSSFTAVIYVTITLLLAVWLLLLGMIDAAASIRQVRVSRTGDDGAATQRRGGRSTNYGDDKRSPH